jgi:N12 class adenine-specific DNA methylase
MVALAGSAAKWASDQSSQNGPLMRQSLRAPSLSRMNALFFEPMRTWTFMPASRRRSLKRLFVATFVNSARQTPAGEQDWIGRQRFFAAFRRVKRQARLRTAVPSSGVFLSAARGSGRRKESQMKPSVLIIDLLSAAPGRALSDYSRAFEPCVPMAVCAHRLRQVK